MIKDRGNIKWSALMLSEHRKELRKLLAGDNELELPEIDEQKLTEMNYLLEKSIHENISISIGYYQDKGFLKLTGKVRNFEPIKKEILLITSEGKTRSLNLEKIVEIKVI